MLPHVMMAPLRRKTERVGKENKRSGQEMSEGKRNKGRREKGGDKREKHAGNGAGKQSGRTCGEESDVRGARY